mgnify:CR=1 FL=1
MYVVAVFKAGAPLHDVEAWRHSAASAPQTCVDHHLTRCVAVCGQSIAKLQSLLVLDLRGCAGLTDKHLAHMFVGTKQLKHLELSGCVCYPPAWLWQWAST